jgi:hypothetical protein
MIGERASKERAMNTNENCRNMSVNRNLKTCDKDYIIHVETGGRTVAFGWAGVVRHMLLILSSKFMISVYDGDFCVEACETSAIRSANLRKLRGSEHDAVLEYVVVHLVEAFTHCWDEAHPQEPLCRCNATPTESSLGARYRDSTWLKG